MTATTITPTAADYAEYLGQLYPGDWSAADLSRINAGLVTAAETVADQVRTQAVLDRTDAGTIAALNRAGCAQFEYDEETGDTTGAQSNFNSAGIGSLSLSRGTAQTAGVGREDGLIAPKALRTLRLAGLQSGIVGHL